MTAKSQVVEKLTVIGGGLIGGSLVREARNRNLANHISLFDADPSHRQYWQDQGIAHNVPHTIDKAVQDADMVILCVPVGSMSSLMQDMAPHLKAGAIVSDVGSTKANVLRQMQNTFGSQIHCIPAHPVAGTENSGPTASLLGLFQDRWCIITPPQDADQTAVQTVHRIWSGLGATVCTMTADHHDRVLGMTSHLPHLIAYTIVGTAKDLEDMTQSEVIKFSAGGFRDFTRIAASDPTMWRDIFLNNQSAVLDLIGQFKADLSQLEHAIAQGDGQELYDFFTRTRDIRKAVIDAKQATGPTYFETEPIMGSPYSTDLNSEEA